MKKIFKKKIKIKKELIENLKNEYEHNDYLLLRLLEDGYELSGLIEYIKEIIYGG